ncbi:hypothetical protein GCM10011390_07060 [Aureimonas endophytica]|uniref:Uncharacterized protein n=1 Tax=Aureimonas endophytica TaxID=2027858 RepID=A0A916ZDZ7_9HYPH|nr:hypothetical protein GCM10011390_07060 [Aureimonas endophytica]
MVIAMAARWRDAVTPGSWKRGRKASEPASQIGKAGATLAAVAARRFPRRPKGIAMLSGSIS